MKFNFDETVDRSGTNSIKYEWREKIFGENNIIPLWVADMEFKAPPAVLKALQKRLDHGIFGYTMRDDEYFEIIQNWLKLRYNWHVPKSSISFSPGVVSALAMSVMAFTKPGDKIIVQSPVYFPFFTTVENNGRRILNNQLKLIDGQYEMDFDDLEKQVDHNTKMIILSNPHNPVGRAWTKGELSKLADFAAEHNLLVVSDEIHADIIFSGHKHTPFASVSEDAAIRTITCMAPSKTFNLAGLSTSVVVSEDKDLLEEYNQMVDNYHIGLTSPFGLEALKAAYGQSEEWLDELIVYLEGNRDYIHQFVTSELDGVKSILPESTYLHWLDFRELGLSEDRVNHLLVKQAGIGLSNGAMFGAGGEGFQRLNFGCPRKTIEEALERLKKVL